MKTDSRSTIRLEPVFGALFLEMYAEGPEDPEFFDFLAALSDKLESILLEDAPAHLLVVEQLGSSGPKVKRYAIDQAGPLGDIRLEFKLIYESKLEVDGASLRDVLEAVLRDYLVPLAVREMTAYCQYDDFHLSGDGVLDSLEMATSGSGTAAEIDT